MEGLDSISRQLAVLARSKSAEDRERLLAALERLCGGAAAAQRPEVQALLAEVLMALVAGAEHDIRVRLAERLAPADWAPHAVVSALSLDDIEIAAPVIARSPLLQDADLVRLVTTATVEHAIAVARRPELGPPVVEAILDDGRPEALAALAGNATADLGGPAMSRLVEAARTVAAVRAPLSRHPQLPPDLALSLYVWVGEALRGALVARFDLPPEKLQAALDAAVRDAHAGAPAGRGGALAADEQGQMETRLVAKLDAAGQLRPGYLLRALREGKLGLFQTTLATLGGFSLAAVREACDGDRPERLALACAAAGVDRSVFPSLLDLVQGLNGERPLSSPATARSVQAAFSAHNPATAAEAFRNRAVA